jgi:two-component system response regulator
MSENRGTILLVEDNPDDEELARQAFAAGDIARLMAVARDGQEALDYLFAEGPHAGRDVCEQPQLILLDLKLPKVDGLEVLRRIRSHELTRLLPVIILTTSNEARDLIEGYALGANSYIRKPVDFAQFAETAHQIGLYWLRLNQPPPSSCCRA